MLIQTLFSSPQMFFIMVLAIVYALTIHEFSHALAATYLGDDTAKYSGRLSLNPLMHLEFLGTLMLLFAGFGWGRPVPVNIYNLRFRRWGESLVALAGPLSNFLSVVLFIIIIRLVIGFVAPDSLVLVFLAYLILVNLILGVFNLIPIPPLDGSRLLYAILPYRFDDFKQKFAVNGPWLLLVLILIDNFSNINVFGRIYDFFINLVQYFL